MGSSPKQQQQQSLYVTSIGRCCCRRRHRFYGWGTATTTMAMMMMLLVMAMLIPVTNGEQVDITITETDSGVMVTIQGNLDTTSGLTLMGTDSSNSIDPFLKIGSTDDNSFDILMLNQKSTEISYYLVDGSWSFDCIAKPTYVFKFVDPNGDNFEKSIGMLVNNGETASVVLTADGDYSTIDETGSISVANVNELGLISGTTCFMTFGNNRIQVQVIGLEDAKNNNGGKVVASPTTNDVPTPSSSSQPVVGSPSTTALADSPTASPVQSSTSVTVSPTGVPCDFFDLFCQGAKLVGGLL